jgi:REP element-mobilizing transposase RayT
MEEIDMTERITHLLEADDTLSHVQDANGTTLTRLLEANGTRFIRDFNKGDIQSRRGAYLPHWTIENAVYHVRFSLTDAIPGQIRRNLLTEKEIILKKLKNDAELNGRERKELIRFYSQKVETMLDAGHGSCWLANEPIAVLVSDALEFFNNERYFIYAWAIMPNHVHAVVQPFAGYKLSRVLHSWKSFTANKANEILGRSGAFWANEYFDHLMRDEAGLIKSIEYVYRNPEVASIRSRWYRFKVEY